MSLCAAIALTGLYLSYLHGKRLKFLKELASFFEELGQLCFSGTGDICLCLERLYKKQKHNELTFLGEILCEYKNGDNFKEVWKRSVKNNSSYLADSEVNLLLEAFSEAFGKGTREDFCKSCSDYSVVFRQLFEREEKKREKSRELTVYSGVLAAAAVFFIFI